MKSICGALVNIIDGEFAGQKASFSKIISETGAEKICKVIIDGKAVKLKGKEFTFCLKEAQQIFDASSLS